MTSEQIHLKTIYDRIQAARNAIDELHEEKKINESEIIGDFSLIDLVDYLDSINSTIETKLDDRPQPFSIFEDFNYICRYAKTEKEKEDSERELKMFAEVGCFSHKYPNSSALYLGGYEFSVENAIRLRDWLISVIAWHHSKGHMNSGILTNNDI